MAAQICEYCKHKGSRCYCAPNSTCSKYESNEIKDDEIVEEIISFDIKVKTNKNKEKIVCFTDFKNSEESLTINHSDFKPYRQIIVEINCDGYSMGIK